MRQIILFVGTSVHLKTNVQSIEDQTPKIPTYRALIDFKSCGIASVMHPWCVLISFKSKFDDNRLKLIEHFECFFMGFYQFDEFLHREFVLYSLGSNWILQYRVPLA